MWWIKVKKTGQILQLRTGKKTGYLNKGRAVTALKSSGIMYEEGLLWTDLELVNRWGKSMAEMMIVAPVPCCYALRHREGWYWMNPASSQKIWFRRPGDAERCWNVAERDYAAKEGRRRRENPGAAGFQMVHCEADGSVVVLKHWY